MIENIEDDANVCQSCGQRLSYKGSVSRGTVQTLRAIAKFIEQKGINIVHLEKEMVQMGRLTGNQSGNAKGHMVRLGLLAHLKEEPGNYCLTEKAMGFLNGMPIPRHVSVSKRTEVKGSHTVTHSDEMCTVNQFNKAGDYWEVPGFEIRAGRVILGNSKVVEV